MKDKLRQIIEKRTVETVAAVFLVTLIVGTAVASTVTGGNTSDGLVAEYRFNEGGGDIAYDSAGGNDGNFINNPKWVRDSVRGSVLEFDGSGDYVDASPHPFEDESPEEFTASAWFKMDDTPSQSWASVFSTRNGGSGDGFWIFIDSGTFPLDISYSMDFVDSGRVHSSINPSGVINQNQWHHGTVTWDGSEFKAYLDGELVGKYTASGEEAEIADNFFIGWDGNNQYPFPGRIDDARIYSEAISEQEVKSLYNEGSVSMSSSTEDDSPRPVLNMDFNLIENNQVIDRSGNENHGSINGAEEKGAVHCQEGRCMEFDGDNAIVEIPGLEEVGFGNTASLTAWVKLEEGLPSNSDRTGLFHIEGSGSSNTHYPWTNGEAYFSTFRDNRIDNIVLDDGIDRTEWHLVTVITEPGTNGWKLYQNNKLVYETDGENDVSIDKPVTLGNSESGHFLNGKLDELRLYNRTLSKEEIWHLYSQGRDRLGSTDMAGPVGHWRLDGNLFFQDDFCRNTESKYVKTEHNSRGSLTNDGWVIEEGECQIRSDSSNSDLTIHSKPSITRDIDDVHVNVEYLGTDDDDGSGPAIYDSDDDRWWVGSITNDHGCNGIGYIEGSDVNCVVAGDNWDVTQEHTFDLYYKDGTLEFYVNGEKSAEHTATISPDGFGMLSDAQDPPAYYDSIEVRSYEADDVSGEGNHGKMEGFGLNPSWVNDPERGAVLEFDGENDFIDFGITETFQRPSDQDWSVSLKVFVEKNSGDVAGNTNAGIIGNRRNSDNTWEIWHSDSGEIRFELNGNNNLRERAIASDIELGRWYSVTGIYREEGDFKLYIDGELEDTATYTDTGDFDSPNHNGVIGERSGDSSRRFPGRVSDVRVYPYALSENQIKQVMNQGSATFR